MRSYESPKTYIIWDSPFGCIHEDITDYAQSFIERISKIFGKESSDE